MNFEAERNYREMHINDQKHTIDIFRINSEERRSGELNTRMNNKKENRRGAAKNH